MNFSYLLLCFLIKIYYLCTQYDLPRFPLNSAPGEVFEFLWTIQNALFLCGNK